MNPNFHIESAAEKIEPSLKALQVHYRDIIKKYQPLVDRAHAQLIYIDGILSGLSASPKSQGISTDKIVPPQAPKSVKTTQEIVDTTPPIAKVPRKTNKPTNSSKSLSFLAEYTGETLTSAVERILGDRQGREVGIEEVVSALYGNIDAEQFKVGKDRVTKNLSKGKVTGLWDRVPNKSGYYIAKS
jgi:hypothetical protein